ncbi:MAG: hypothetical protein LCH67_03610 [Bacteroidetes bacterium]|nr:hypothetical protein [Bacteroidota bacterium]
MKDEELKDQMINFRIPAELKEKVLFEAQKSNQTITKWLLKCINNELKPKIVKVEKKVVVKPVATLETNNQPNLLFGLLFSMFIFLLWWVFNNAKGKDRFTLI